jgi:hypothetical protein
MTEVERAEWLAGLKVGDKVLIGANSIGIIEKITPKRLFDIKQDNNHITRYNKDGCYNYNGWQHEYIYPCTIEDEKRIVHRNIHIKYVNKVEKINWQRIDFNRLEKIVKILEDE